MAKKTITLTLDEVKTCIIGLDWYQSETFAVGSKLTAHLETLINSLKNRVNEVETDSYVRIKVSDLEELIDGYEAWLGEVGRMKSQWFYDMKAMLGE